MKGIILAGGQGTRLYPVTLSVCKQLLPVYDKPMIYYPLSVLMMAGIQEILIISTPEDRPRFEQLFGDGGHLGLKLSYAVQEKPDGIATAFLIGEKFIGEESVALILGDNIFYGHDLSAILTPCRNLEEGAVIFGYEVKDPQRYGVVEFNPSGKVIDIVEKPEVPKSRFAVTGLYFYDNDVIEIARNLKPSQRGEYEITDVNRAYLNRGDLNLQLLDRGFAWLDTGTHSALQQASLYVQTIQERQGISIACLEEIAYKMGFITQEQLQRQISLLTKSDYGQYLIQMLARENIFVSGTKN
ncbi:MAG: glucose-1-phosphate thymidylyltransferase RfbA [Candidatus Melainabacteria bacterium]|nr:glucose-1-phosphate thymidylyltransferase RfbA [Candidatus Melainabacteria bacterium]